MQFLTKSTKKAGFSTPWTTEEQGGFLRRLVVAFLAKRRRFLFKVTKKFAFCLFDITGAALYNRGRVEIPD